MVSLTRPSFSAKATLIINILLDGLFLAGFVVAFFICEYSSPEFMRVYDPNDPNLQYPYTPEERVPIYLVAVRDQLNSIHFPN